MSTNIVVFIASICLSTTLLIKPSLATIQYPACLKTTPFPLPRFLSNMTCGTIHQHLQIPLLLQMTMKTRMMKKSNLFSVMPCTIKIFYVDYPTCINVDNLIYRANYFLKKPLKIKRGIIVQKETYTMLPHQFAFFGLKGVRCLAKLTSKQPCKPKWWTILKTSRELEALSVS